MARDRCLAELREGGARLLVRFRDGDGRPHPHARRHDYHDVADAEARGWRCAKARASCARSSRPMTRADLLHQWLQLPHRQHRASAVRRQPEETRYSPATTSFVSDYWTTHPWYSDDPFGTEQTNPAWYFGSLTKQLAQDGNDIESHAFGHLFLHAGITPQQLDDDLAAWDQVAKENGFAPAHSFAFPWGASNSLTAEYYAVLAKHGITNVTRYYDLEEAGDGATRCRTRLPVDSRRARSGTDRPAGRRGGGGARHRTALAQGGVFSIWAHPENIATRPRRQSGVGLSRMPRIDGGSACGSPR